MLTTGTVSSPIGHTRAVPLPGRTTIRPVQRRNTSPFTTSAAAAPDPDAIARLERLGYVTVQAVVVDERPMKIVTRRKGKRPANRSARRPAGPRRLDLDPGELAAEYEAGSTVEQVAERHHATPATIRARLRDAGVQIRGRSVTELASTSRILDLHEEGLSRREIAAEVGLSDVTVGKRLRAAGIRVGRGNSAVFDEDLAIAMAREGATAYAISKAVGVCRRTILDRLAVHGITFDVVDQRRADIDRLIELGRAGRTITQIANELEVSTRTVSTHLSRAGIVPPDGRARNANAPRVDVTPEELAVDYQAGFSISEIAKKHDASVATVRRRLATIKNLEWRDDRSTRNGGANRTSPDVEDAIVDRYQGGMHAGEVAEHLNVPTSTVLHVLERRGIPRRTAGQSQQGRPGVDGAAGLKELMRSNGVTAADVRAWAISTGRDIPARGLPSRHLVETYLLESRTPRKESA